MPHWDWRWCAEIEPFPSAVLAARHPQSVNLGDVTAHDFAERAAKIARPNVIVFGSPCQGFSVAGKRLGLDDPRSNLALCALAIIARLKPDWFVFENVPGLFSSFSGSESAEREVREGPVGRERDGEEDRDFAAFLSAVHELGYSGAWTVLDAQWRGVAQRRERLFFVCHIGDWRYPAAVLLEPESLSGDSPPRREAGKGIAPTINARTKGGGGLGTDFDCDGGLIPSHDVSHPLLGKENGSHRADAESYIAYTPIISPALKARDAKGPSSYGDGDGAPLIAHALRGDGFDASEDGTGRGTPIVPILEVGKRTASGGVGRNGRGAPEEVCPPLKAESGETGRGDSAPLTFIGHNQSWKVRRLLPVECEKLQGFEPGYLRIQFRGKPAADGPMYRALGNSMAVPIISLILERIEMLEQILETEGMT